MRNIPGLDRGDWAGYCKAVRAATSLGTKQLALRAGVSRETWWRWESGRQRPESAEVTERFATGFSLPPDEVMWAAGLAIEDSGTAQASDPRLKGLNPHDRAVQLIMSAPVTERVRSLMLDRHRQKIAQLEEQAVAELRFWLESQEAQQESGDRDARGAA